MPEPEILDLPPEEAVKHFRAKGFHVGFDWRDTDAATHVRSFTVAKAMKLDILQDIRGAMDAAIAEGRTFDWFRDNLEPTLPGKNCRAFNAFLVRRSLLRCNFRKKRC